MEKKALFGAVLAAIVAAGVSSSALAAEKCYGVAKKRVKMIAALAKIAALNFF